MKGVNERDKCRFITYTRLKYSRRNVGGLTSKVHVVDILVSYRYVKLLATSHICNLSTPYASCVLQLLETVKRPLSNA